MLCPEKSRLEKEREARISRLVAMRSASNFVYDRSLQATKSRQRAINAATKERRERLIQANIELEEERTRLRAQYNEALDGEGVRAAELLVEQGRLTDEQIIMQRRASERVERRRFNEALSRQGLQRAENQANSTQHIVRQALGWRRGVALETAAIERRRDYLTAEAKLNSEIEAARLAAKVPVFVLGDEFVVSADATDLIAQSKQAEENRAASMRRFLGDLRHRLNEYGDTTLNSAWEALNKADEQRRWLAAELFSARVRAAGGKSLSLPPSSARAMAQAAFECLEEAERQIQQQEQHQRSVESINRITGPVKPRPRRERSSYGAAVAAGDDGVSVRYGRVVDSRDANRFMPRQQTPVVHPPLVSEQVNTTPDSVNATCDPDSPLTETVALPPPLVEFSSDSSDDVDDRLPPPPALPPVESPEVDAHDIERASASSSVTSLVSLSRPSVHLSDSPTTSPSSDISNGIRMTSESISPVVLPPLSSVSSSSSKSSNKTATLSLPEDTLVEDVAEPISPPMSPLKPQTVDLTREQAQVQVLLTEMEDILRQHEQTQRRLRELQAARSARQKAQQSAEQQMIPLPMAPQMEVSQRICDLAMRGLAI